MIPGMTAVNAKSVYDLKGNRLSTSPNHRAPQFGETGETTFEITPAYTPSAKTITYKAISKESLYYADGSSISMISNLNVSTVWYGSTLYGELLQAKLIDDTKIQSALNTVLKKNHSYIWNFKIRPSVLYLFSDGTVGTLGDKGTRTPIAVVVKEKTNTEEGTAVALKECINQWGTKDFGYGAFPPAGTRLFKKNNTSNYSDMASTLNDVDGYKWTWETAGSEEGTVKANDNNNYTCFYAAANYHPGVATQNIGKWYLPATGEMKQLITCYGTPTITTINEYNVELKFDYINLINKAFTDAGGDAISGPSLGYWTSSEVVYSFGGGGTSNQTPVLYYDPTKKAYIVGQRAARHNNTCRIRPFVHF